MMMQATLRDRIAFEGIGIHTGAQCRAEVFPAGPDEGISFLVRDTRVPAIVEFVVDTSRATVLGRDGVSVSTTEHLLSALFALGVSNAEIVVEGPEVPICDGSALHFVDAIVACGLEEQAAERKIVDLDEPIIVRAGEKLMAAFPATDLHVRFVADFPEPIGTQYFAGAIDGAQYREQLAGARTFGFLHEWETLLARGLARGGSLENALVFDADGPLQPLRWPNEAVRHKVLDLIGDLALLGAWPRCELVAIKSGHELHAAMTRGLRRRLKVLSA